MSVIAFSPNVGALKFDCVLLEDHVSEIEITGNPVETGSEINDHAFVKPKEVKIEVADANAAIIFNALVLFQESRIPFAMMTGLTLYRNMMVKSIKVHRDKSTAKILRAVIILGEVNIVSTSSASTSDKASNSPGGKNSRVARDPTAESASNDVTADRTSGTVSRGDTPSETVPEAKSGSLLKQVFE